MSTLSRAHEVIRQYSKTWYEPVVGLPPRLNEATSCAYLCMRAIDEIEDHPSLAPHTKSMLLREVSRILQTRFSPQDFRGAFKAYEHALPEVTLRLDEWAFLAPLEIAPRVLDTFSVMAERMADWVECGWVIRAERDLDHYTYAVAGTLALLLSDLWAWHDNTPTNRTYAIGYGRALQAANILIDRSEDMQRGVDFWPTGWYSEDVIGYVDRELDLADAYFSMLPARGPAHRFCDQPLKNAYSAVEAFRRAQIAKPVALMS